MDSNKEIVLLGTGAQAKEYLKVFRHLGCLSKSIVWGRSPEKLSSLETAFSVATTNKFADLPKGPGVSWINSLASGVLFDFTLRAIENGASKLLLEKPACLHMSQLRTLLGYKNLDIGIALNRRYFSSIKTIKKWIDEDEFSPLSCVFDFTELSHLVSSGNYTQDEKSRWALVNSIHVFDTVRFLLGDFQWKNRLRLRETGLPWHPSGSSWVFQGLAGNVPVVGLADWCAPGRWSIELNSSQRKIKLSPMESISYMDRGSFEWKSHLLYDPNTDLKPGLLSLVTDLLSPPRDRSPSWTDLQDYQGSFGSIVEAFGY